MDNLCNQICTSCAIRMLELQAKLDKAVDIIKDMEKGDDAQAFKEARKFLHLNATTNNLEEIM